MELLPPSYIAWLAPVLVALVLCNFKPIYFAVLFTYLVFASQILDISSNFSGVANAAWDSPAFIAALLLWDRGYRGAGLIVLLIAMRFLLHYLRAEGVLDVLNWIRGLNGLFILGLLTWVYYWNRAKQYC